MGTGDVNFVPVGAEDKGSGKGMAGWKALQTPCMSK